MKTGKDRKYTAGFREGAVKQVLQGGRSAAAVARGLEMSEKTLHNWISRARRGQALVHGQSAQAVAPDQAEMTRLKQENARLRMEKEILKKAAAYFAKESL